MHHEVKTRLETTELDKDMRHFGSHDRKVHVNLLWEVLMSVNRQKAVSVIGSLFVKQNLEFGPTTRES
jgi:hypothetical protein